MLLAACLTVALTHTVLTRRKDVKSCGYLAAHLDKTLVVHIFADTDPEYLENLMFFIQHGILQEDNAEYVLLIQTDSSTIVRASRALAFGPFFDIPCMPSSPWLCAVCQIAGPSEQRQVRPAQERVL